LNDAVRSINTYEHSVGKARNCVATPDHARDAELACERGAVIERSAGFADERGATDDKHGERGRNCASHDDIAFTDDDRARK
jgi:hypothetical protein